MGKVKRRIQKIQRACKKTNGETQKGFGIIRKGLDKKESLSS